MSWKTLVQVLEIQWYYKKCMVLQMEMWYMYVCVVEEMIRITGIPSGVLPLPMIHTTTDTGMIPTGLFQRISGKVLLFYSMFKCNNFRHLALLVCYFQIQKGSLWRPLQGSLLQGCLWCPQKTPTPTRCGNYPPQQ